MPEFKDDAKLIDQICLEMKELKPMLQATFDGQANTACRSNNKAICEAEEDEPQPGGNIEAYKKLNAYPDLDTFEEFT